MSKVPRQKSQNYIKCWKINANKMIYFSSFDYVSSKTRNVFHYTARAIKLQSHDVNLRELSNKAQNGQLPMKRKFQLLIYSSNTFRVIPREYSMNIHRQLDRFAGSRIIGTRFENKFQFASRSYRRLPVIHRRMFQLYEQKYQ